MLDYIKSQIAAREEANAITFSDDTSVDDNIIVECAHLFQELDDISIEGTDATADRPVAIEIPLDDDIEIESIEFNIGDGRLTDIPMDATVQESYDETKMKSFDDFYQEAYQTTTRFPRDNEMSFKKRVMSTAIDKQSKYIDDVTKKGLFGFDKISMASDKVPTTIMVNISSKRAVMVTILYETVKSNKITKRQIKALNTCVDYSNDATMNGHESIGSMISKDLREKYPDEFNGVEEITDRISIPNIIVPIQKDKSTYKIYVGFGKNDVPSFGKPEDFMWEYSISRAARTTPVSGDDDDTKENVKNFNLATSSVAKMPNISLKSKYQVIKESAIPQPKRSLSRFDTNDYQELYYQEAIDFGDPNESPVPAEEVGDGADPTVTVDEPDKKPTEDALPVDTNDVSDDIAKKVADTAAAPEDDNPTTDDLDGDITSDIPLDDEGTGDTDSDIDGKLDELNSLGNTSDPATDGISDSDESLDFDNMTMDDLLAKGAEKLKGMTMAQLKEFMDGNPDAKIDDSLTQESFFMSTKNINKKMSDQLRVVSGILNDTEMKFADIVIEFKKQGKDLNKILSKAGKAKKIYTEEDRTSINKLNSILVDLINHFKDNPSENEATMIKRIIKEFVSYAVAVNEIIERVAGE